MEGDDVIIIILRRTVMDLVYPAALKLGRMPE
jgi:hypothetical protein